MKSKFKKIFTLLVFFSLCASNATSSTHGIENTSSLRDPDHRPVHPIPDFPASGRRLVETPVNIPHTHLESAASSAFLVGQPGLSFRYVQTFGVSESPYPEDTL